MPQPFQKAMYPDCFKLNLGDCNPNLVRNQSYIQLCGIIAGMLVWGYVGDVFGRKWGSRIVSSVMLSGSILLTATPFTTADPTAGYHYLCFFIVAETWCACMHARVGRAGRHAPSLSRARMHIRAIMLLGRILLTFTPFTMRDPGCRQPLSVLFHCHRYFLHGHAKAWCVCMPPDASPSTSGVTLACVKPGP